MSKVFCLYNWKNEFPLVKLENKLGGETLGKDQEFVFHTQR